MSCPALPEGFDFTDPDLHQHRVPLPEFAQLRQTAPVSWIPQRHGIAGYDDDGYRSVTRHADVKELSTRPEIFSSHRNTAIIRFNEHIQRDQIEVQKLIMLNMDPPEHTRVRQIVQRGFTPRAPRPPPPRARSAPWRPPSTPARPASWPGPRRTAPATSSPTSPANSRSR